MTDKQLDKLQDQASIVAERAFWDERHADIDDTALKDLIADYRRLRKLDRAVRAMREFAPDTLVWQHNYDAIGRLMKEAEGE